MEQTFNVYVQIYGPGDSAPTHDAIAKALRPLLVEGTNLSVGSGVSTQSSDYVVGAITPEVINRSAQHGAPQVAGYRPAQMEVLS